MLTSDQYNDRTWLLLSIILIPFMLHLGTRAYDRAHDNYDRAVIVYNQQVAVRNDAINKYNQTITDFESKGPAYSIIHTFTSDNPYAKPNPAVTIPEPTVSAIHPAWTAIWYVILTAAGIGILRWPAAILGDVQYEADYRRTQRRAEANARRTQQKIDRIDRNNSRAEDNLDAIRDVTGHLGVIRRKIVLLDGATDRDAISMVRADIHDQITEIRKILIPADVCSSILKNKDVISNAKITSASLTKIGYAKDPANLDLVHIFRLRRFF